MGGYVAAVRVARGGRVVAVRPGRDVSRATSSASRSSARSTCASQRARRGAPRSRNASRSPRTTGDPRRNGCGASATWMGSSTNETVRPPPCRGRMRCRFIQELLPTDAAPPFRSGTTSTASRSRFEGRVAARRSPARALARVAAVHADGDLRRPVADAARAVILVDLPSWPSATGRMRGPSRRTSHRRSTSTSAFHSRRRTTTGLLCDGAAAAVDRRPLRVDIARLVGRRRAGTPPAAAVPLPPHPRTDVEGGNLEGGAGGITSRSPAQSSNRPPHPFEPFALAAAAVVSLVLASVALSACGGSARRGAAAPATVPGGTSAATTSVGVPVHGIEVPPLPPMPKLVPPVRRRDPCALRRATRGAASECSATRWRCRPGRTPAHRDRPRPDLRRRRVRRHRDLRLAGR